MRCLPESERRGSTEGQLGGTRRVEYDENEAEAISSNPRSKPYADSECPRTEFERWKAEERATKGKQGGICLGEFSS